MNQFKRCTHLRSLNICHFAMAETTKLKKCGERMEDDGGR
jgi:hypothetical protein